MNIPNQSKTIPEQPQGWIFDNLPALVEKVSPLIVKTWGRTLKIKFNGLENIRNARKAGGFLFAMWHGNLLVPIYSHRYRGLYTLVSPVWEGELIASGLKGLGYNLVRASSGYDRIHGIRQSVKIVRDGKPLVIIIDGPEGPRREVKQGIIAIAAISGKPIIPVYSTGSPGFNLPSWDKQEIVLPFSKSIINFGVPIYIEKQKGSFDVPKWQEVIKNKMGDLEISTNKLLESWMDI